MGKTITTRYSVDMRTAPRDPILTKSAHKTLKDITPRFKRGMSLDEVAQHAAMAFVVSQYPGKANEGLAGHVIVPTVVYVTDHLYCTTGSWQPAMFQAMPEAADYPEVASVK